MSFLSKIREKEAPLGTGARIGYSAFVLLLGIGMGCFSKMLDCTPSNALPVFLEYLDVRNFLGRFAVWVLIGLWLSVCSPSPKRAAFHVLLFFLGMVSAYYLYSKYIAGFFPKRYAMVWFGFTAVSPLLALFCWYAGGKGLQAFCLSVILLAMLFWCSFVGRWPDIRPRSVLELAAFLCGIWVLRRGSLKATAMMTALGIGLGTILLLIVPFRFG